MTVPILVPRNNIWDVLKRTSYSEELGESSIEYHKTHKITFYSQVGANILEKAFPRILCTLNYLCFTFSQSLTYHYNNSTWHISIYYILKFFFLCYKLRIFRGKLGTSGQLRVVHRKLYLYKLQFSYKIMGNVRVVFYFN